jgi:hypothetical protein
MHESLDGEDISRRGKWHLLVFLPVSFSSLAITSSRASYYETFRGPVAAISLAPSARSGRVHAHVKGVVQQAGLKRQVA